ncbi:LysR family transcriptional regulator [Achromobacter sp. DMS1]|uniref:LysR family transcriptional regulator n=1 Tax=Achromobacter sp. DMS1 TaxID=1688405 RepID=UPI00069D1A86|nr:LysR family transcriptional regulator [Achromobacter sp. DMS1]KOF52068.1 LysR family transcriptional regulator [Achromobacter sp. DMS1]KOF54060.1 LysR family transcriptional regulator [Achromobacter sp. DMS1]
MASLRDVDLNLLLVFQHLLEERNISAVARRMDLTQPAASNALRRLRAAFGDELFVRTGQGMQPTPRAERLAGPVSEALATLSRALQDQNAFDPAASRRRFRVAMSDVGEIHFMPRLMEACAQLAPGVRIDSVRTQGPDLQREMEAGRIDLAVGAFDDMGAGVMQRMLFRQGYATLFRQGHPTAHAGMSLKAFRAERHLIVSRAAPYGQVNQSMERAGLVLAEHFSVPHFSAVPYIVSATDLLATVPEKLAASAAGPFGLRYIAPPVKVPPLQTNMYWQRRYDRDGGSQWLRGLIAEVFGADGQQAPVARAGAGRRDATR